MIGVFEFPDEVGSGVGPEVCDCEDVEEVIVAASLRTGVGDTVAVVVLVVKVEESADVGIDANVCLVVARLEVREVTGAVDVELESVSGQAGKAHGSTEQQPLKLFAPQA